MLYRAVARFLHTKFLARKKRGENEVVKLSQAVEGKSKKRNARLFYELLVRRFFFSYCYNIIVSVILTVTCFSKSSFFVDEELV